MKMEQVEHAVLLFVEVIIVVGFVGGFKNSVSDYNFTCPLFLKCYFR